MTGRKRPHTEEVAMRSVLATRKEPDVFGPTKRARQKGNPKKMWGFRPSAELEQFADLKTEKDPKTGQRKYELSALLVEMLEFRMQLEQELGDDWRDLMAISIRDQKPLAVVVAEVLRPGLKKHR